LPNGIYCPILELEVGFLIFMITVSPSAATEIKRLLSKQQESNQRFRLTVKSGGCSGLFYDMSFAQTIDTSDFTFDTNGIQVVIDTSTLSYVNGLKLDYSEDLMGGGFRFDNPQAKISCGCGNSFAIEGE
jgi:iron-sulfur cluster assembly protein